MITNQLLITEFEPLEMLFRKLAEEAPQNARSIGGTLWMTGIVERDWDFHYHTRGPGGPVWHSQLGGWERA